jgi:RNA polymerase sigma factor (TIGR02999 family)
LGRLDAGDRDAIAELAPLVYNELHALAAHYLRHERNDHTLQPTALVNEAWLRLASREDPRWENRRHFYRAAAIVMRSILVNHARDRRRLKRGGQSKRVPLDDALLAFEDRAVDLIALDDALTKLALLDPRQIDIVELRFFAGLTIKETAETLGVSPRTVDADWSLARSWLQREMSAA